MKSNKRQSKSIWHRIISFLLYSANILAGIGLVVCSYSGYIDPREYALASVPGLIFPFWLAGTIILFIISILIRWRAALAGACFIIVSLPAILDFSPLKTSRKADSGESTFSLMTYNCCSFTDFNGNYPDTDNQTISYIINSNADIVCLQECYTISANKSLHITPAQIDSLHNIYPYIFLTPHSQAILSKYPVKPINLETEAIHTNGWADMACYRAEIKGQTITIFNVHLQSYRLHDDDREMYVDLTRLKGSEREMAAAQKYLIRKVAEAAPKRAENTVQLIRYIKKFGGPNVIVCGDFNDVPGCYSLRMLSDEKFRQVYPQVGFGPTITYNSQRFYFRIDHILYRGALRPLSITKGKIKTSDHYPLTTEFEITCQ